MLRRFRKRTGYDHIDHPSDDEAALQHSYEEPDDGSSSGGDEPPSLPQHDDKKVLNAIHVQIVPPSIVDERYQSRRKLNELSKRHCEEMKSHGHWITRGGGTVDTPTTKSSHSSTVTVGGGILSSCQRMEQCNPCVPLARHSLACAGKGSFENLVVPLGCEEECSLVDSHREERGMRHAYDYHPSPPKRRTKSSVNSNNNKSVKEDPQPNREQSEMATVRGRLEADAEYITGRAYEERMEVELNLDMEESVETQTTRDVSKDGETKGGEFQPFSSTNKEKGDFVSSDIVETIQPTNERCKTPLLRAISPMSRRGRDPSDYKGQDPSGTKPLSVSSRGSAIPMQHSNEDSGKEKQYPMLSQSASLKKRNAFRALAPKRSPSPQRPRDAPADIKTPTVKRPGPSPSPTAQQPESTKHTLSKIKRALTPKRSPSPGVTRFFGRNGSVRQRDATKNAEDAKKRMDPPPDPPASPSWKVGGKKYSRRMVERLSRPAKEAGATCVTDPNEVVRRDPRHSIPSEEQDGKASEPRWEQQHVVKQSAPQESLQQPPERASPNQSISQRGKEQQLNSYQRRNYQQYVMLQKQKSKRLGSQQGVKHKSMQHQNHSMQPTETRESKSQQQPSQQQLTESHVRYQMSEAEASKQTDESHRPKAPMQQMQQQQHPTKSPPNNNNVKTLQAPIQLKKVLSSPSVMMSTFTSQTMNTTNTTTTSKFWDGVEGYQSSDPNSPDRNASFETGLHGNPKKFDNLTEEDFVILKKLNEKNKELQKFFQVHKLDENGRRRPLLSRTPPRSRMEAQLAPASPTGSGMESVFSLNLTMNKHGFFDDSDISALAMGDSATVYHMRASAEAKMNSSDYWKEKYEKLKEETRRANQLRGLDEVPLEEDEDNFLRMEPREVVSTHDAKKKKERCNDTAVDDEQSQQLQRQKLLLRCGGYMGGKKAKDLAQNHSAGNQKLNDASKPKKTICSQPVQSILNRAQCFIPGEDADLSLIEITPERRNERPITRRVSSEDELDAEGIANKLQCTRLIIDESKHDVEVTADRLQCNRIGSDKELKSDAANQQRNSANRPRKSVAAEPDVQFIADTFSVKEDAVNDSRADTPLGFESLNSDVRPLRPIGYVQRMQTPSPHLIASDKDVTDGLACYDDPMYVMDDEDALKEWNKNRQPKALADELSATASRGKASSADGSELSEDAKLIFEAALKHDIKTLREQRSRSTSRTPASSHQMRIVSPVQSPARIHPELSGISSFATSGESFLSEHFVSTIPQGFASWFELPSPGISCITLIPMLKGHLKNAVVVELLSAFDGASNKIDANGVHRIKPRHRVSDVAEKSFAEYLDSPVITSKSSIDSEYMGPVIADGEDGSIRFADTSIHLGGISDAATSHIKKREFQDAIDIYTTLLRSCQSMSGWIVEQLIASTLHNLCVLHLWNEEYDLALSFSRECFRMKTENANDNVLVMHSLANMGLIHYAMEAHSSALMAYQNAIDISEGISVDGETSVTGRLHNNLGCVHAEISNMEGALTEFEQSLRCQKDNASSDDADTSDADNLLSISMTIFNIGVSCARQKHYQAAMKHTEASHAMQEALLGTKNELAENTLFYLNLLKKVVATSQSPDRTPKKSQIRQSLEPYRAITRKDEVLDILDVNPESPDRRRKQAMDFEASKHAYPALTKNREISFPMMSLGSLKVEATTVERVRECLDRFDDTLRRSSNRKDNISVGRSLLCRKPPSGTKPHGIPSKLMSYGVKTLRKLEVQTELNDNLERYGPRHPLVGQSHHSLGLVLLCIENYEESIDHFDKSIRINTHAFGAKYPEIASSLMFTALAQFALERFDDAISSVTRVRHMRESELGKKHNEIYQIMNNLACMHFEQGNLNKAESLLQEALDLQREIFGTEPDFLKGVSVVLFNIAFVHAKSGAFPKALIELEGALQIRQDILFEDASTGDITENMAYILAIHQLQHGSGNIDDITNEYITMLRKT